MKARLALSAGILLFAVQPSMSAGALQKWTDTEGNVHFGSAADPDLCCMCQPAVAYEAGRNRTRFSLRHGFERTVSNESVFLSTDGRAWYCEGTREMGRATHKCGLTPQAM